MNYNDYLAQVLESDEEVKKEYDELELEYEILAQILKLRYEKGYTQKELAKICEVKQSEISKFESGRYEPTIEFLKKISDALRTEFHIVLHRKMSI